MPTFVSEQETVWNTTTTPKSTGTFDIAAGDGLVALVAEENFETGQTFNVTNSGTALTWTKTDIASTNNADCYAGLSRTLVAAAQTGITATATRSGGTTGAFGLDLVRFSGVTGFGTPVSSATARQVSVTTTGANSAVVVLIADWSAAAQATRTYLQPAGASTPVELVYSNTTGYTVCAYYLQDVGAAGAKTVGISNAMTTPIAIAIEVIGTAAAAPRRRDPLVTPRPQIIQSSFR